MKKGDPYLEQVEKHRQKIEKVRTETTAPEKLPPRSRVHQNKKKKTSLKLKYPVIRLLVLFFVLLPLTVFAVISNMERNKTAGTVEKGGIETVNFEENGQQEKAKDPADKGEKGKEQDSDDKTAELEPSNKENQDNREASAPSGSPDSSEGKDSTENAPAPGKDPGKAGGANAGEGSSQENGTTQSIMKYHTVKPGETLFRIAMMYYKSQDGIEKIREANGIIDNEIKVGQALKIPLK